MRGPGPGAADQYRAWRVHAYDTGKRAENAGVILRGLATVLAALALFGHIIWGVVLVREDSEDVDTATAIGAIAASALLTATLLAVLLALSTIAETQGLRLQLALLDEDDEDDG